MIDAFTIDSSATCARCGTAIPHGDLRWSSGLASGASHAADFDHCGAGGRFVPVWCSCGWRSMAADGPSAEACARDHESQPPRFEVRLMDARGWIADLGPRAWLAAGATAESLLPEAERAACDLWNDPLVGVCIYDTVERRVVWGDGARVG